MDEKGPGPLKTAWPLPVALRTCSPCFCADTFRGILLSVLKTRVHTERNGKSIQVYAQSLQGKQAKLTVLYRVWNTCAICTISCQAESTTDIQFTHVSI